MTKSEFLAELRRRISSQSSDEVERTISYFSEIIDDRIEDGMDEREAVSSLESIDTIVREMVPHSSEARLDSYPARDVSSIRIRDINCSVTLECSGSDEISLDYYESKHKNMIFPSIPEASSPSGQTTRKSGFSASMRSDLLFCEYREATWAKSPWKRETVP